MCDISVIMPAYNSSMYIRAATESILSQEGVDLELLIIDDGSCDDTLSILRDVSRMDSRVRLISRANTGYVVALNEMLDLARGEFIARMDADDVSAPGRLAAQAAFLRANPDYVMVGGAVIEIDEWGRTIGTPSPVLGDAAIQSHLLKGQNPITHPAVMMRASAVRQVGPYNPKWETTEDLDYWLRLGEIGRLENLPQVVLHYRIHPQSVSARMVLKQMRFIKQICDEACARRGLPPLYEPTAPHRPVGSDGQYGFYLMYGWRAFLRGDRPCAMSYAFKAFAWRPWNPAGWRLLACVLLKRRPSAQT
jgi:glycosyltransferase involved in cell wall biosynthesis